MLTPAARAALAAGRELAHAGIRWRASRRTETIEPIEIRTCAGCGAHYWAYAPAQTHCNLWCAFPRPWSRS